MSANPNDPWPHDPGEADDGVFHAERPRRWHHARLVGEPEPVHGWRRGSVVVGAVLAAVAIAALGWLAVGADLVG